MSIDDLAREAGRATNEAAREMPVAPVGAVRLARRRRAWAGAVAAAAAVLAIGVPLVLLPASPEVGPTESTVVEPSTTVPETTIPETTVPETTVPETTLPPTTVPETTVPPTTVPATTIPPADTEPSCNFATHDGHQIPDAAAETCQQLATLLAQADLASLDALTGPDFIVEIGPLYIGPGWPAVVEFAEANGGSGEEVFALFVESLSYTPRLFQETRYVWPGWTFVATWEELTPVEQGEVLDFFDTSIEEIEAPGFFTVEEWYADLASEKPLRVDIDSSGTILYIGSIGS